jgi:hypothetical protein
VNDNPFDAVTRRRTRRDDLIAQVANGLAPDEAERISLAEGLGSLLNNPTYADIDGFAELRWTLLMAFAWAAWGQNPDHIRLYFPDYRAQCREWVRAGQGHIIAPLKQYNAHGAIQPLRQDWHDDIGSVVGSTGATARLAWDNLRAKFRADQIGTFGQLVNETARGVVPIPAVNWQGLLLMPPTGQLVDSLCYADGQPVYFNVTVDKTALLAAYPPRAEPVLTAVDRTPKQFRPAEIEKYKAEVAAAVEASPEKAPEGRGRAYWIGEGRNRFNFPKTVAETAYKEAVDEAKHQFPDHGWSNVGRPKGPASAGK